MELYEVITPHVAIPVLGVLICAFLVFAFGFKAPAQPPSFDFDEERRQKKFKKKQKSNANVLASSELSDDARLTQRTKANAPHAYRNKSLNHDDNQRPARNVPVVKRAAKTDHVQIEDDQGDWTTFVSRKDKKYRNKKDEGDESDPDNMTVRRGKKKDTASPGKVKEKKAKKPVMPEKCSEGEKEKEVTAAMDTASPTQDIPSVAPVPSTPPPPPPPPIFDVEIDIQSLDRKPPINVSPVTPQAGAKSPKKKVKDKKDKSPVKDAKVDSSKNNQVKDAKVDSSKNNQVKDAKVDSSKNNQVKDAKVDSSKNNQVKDAKVDSSKNNQVKDAKVDSSKNNQVKDAKVDSSKNNQVKDAKVDSSKNSQVKDAKVDSSKNSQGKDAKVDSSKNNQVKDAKLDSSKNNQVKDAKLDSSKNNPVKDDSNKKDPMKESSNKQIIPKSENVALTAGTKDASPKSLLASSDYKQRPDDETSQNIQEVACENKPKAKKKKARREN